MLQFNVRIYVYISLHIVHNVHKGRIKMPKIRPVLDLRNYTEVLNREKEDSPVYLTINSHREYAIVKLNGLDKL